MPTNNDPQSAGRLVFRATQYLGNGGLFNPELMEHGKVRDLIMDCRDFILATPPSTPSPDCEHAPLVTVDKCPACGRSATTEASP